jgi:hypothetical protein
LQALWLTALAGLLPLPLRHHLWVQLLSLCVALSRPPTAGALHALQPGRAEQCCWFVAAARAAMLALVPGASPASRPDPSGQRCCWMLHAWMAVVVGYGLPTAVHAALWQHARRRGQQGGPPCGAGSGEQAQQAQQGQQQPPPSSSAAGPSTSGPSTSRTTATDGPQVAASEADHVLAASGSQAANARRLQRAAQRWPALSKQQLVGAALLAGSLGQWLLLLLQAAALVWAGLELVASF